MPILSAPTSLSVSSSSASAVALGWTAVAGAASYDVYRAGASAAGVWGAFTKINDSAVATNAYTDNAANSTPDPSAGTSYAYYVVAVNVSGSSQASNIVNATFQAAAARPALPFAGGEDLDVFFNTDEFAQGAIYTRYGYAPTTIRVIFDRTTADSEGQGMSIENNQPSVLTKSSNVLYASNRDTLALNGITFKVVDKDEDGTGLATLRISKDAPK